jgi:putative tryptophan/tyrosine transport system substrate-binding protein
MIGRRAFITLLGGTAAWPLAARAQQREKMRRIGVLLNNAADDPESQRRMTAFVQGLQQSGWTDGRNVQIEARWGAGDAERLRKNAVELVSMVPDVVVAEGSASLGPLLQLTRAIPVVFTIVPDPVGAGFVDSLARPGGNATGFSQFEFGLSGKWLELLKEIASNVTRAAVLREAGLTAGVAQFAALQAVAPSLRVELVPLNVRDEAQIESSVAAFAPTVTDGMIVTSSPLAAVHRKLIIALAARHKLPTVYAVRYMVAAGGLLSYGPDFVDQYRGAASYVDRILRGEKPADLPVQAPVKYETVINLKTARELGLEVPAYVLPRADEVIE